MQVLIGVLLLIPVAITAQSMALTASAIGLVLFAGIASSVVAAYCWMRGVQVMGSDRAAIFMNLLPLFTALIAVLALGETIEIYHILGGTLILFGVLLAQRNGQFPQIAK